MPFITKLRGEFIPKVRAKKVIPVNIYNLLTSVVLAHFIMGDHSTERHGLIICTDSYSVKDIVRLINVLIIRYRLNCTLHYHSSTQPAYLCYITRYAFTSKYNTSSHTLFYGL